MSCHIHTSTRPTRSPAPPRFVRDQFWWEKTGAVHPLVAAFAIRVWNPPKSPVDEDRPLKISLRGARSAKATLKTTRRELCQVYDMREQLLEELFRGAAADTTYTGGPEPFVSSSSSASAAASRRQSSSGACAAAGGGGGVGGGGGGGDRAPCPRRASTGSRSKSTPSARASVRADPALASVVTAGSAQSPAAVTAAGTATVSASSNISSSSNSSSGNSPDSDSSAAPGQSGGSGGDASGGRPVNEGGNGDVASPSPAVLSAGAGVVAVADAAAAAAAATAKRGGSNEVANGSSSSSSSSTGDANGSAAGSGGSRKRARAASSSSSAVRGVSGKVGMKSGSSTQGAGGRGFQKLDEQRGSTDGAAGVGEDKRNEDCGKQPKPPEKDCSGDPGCAAGASHTSGSGSRSDDRRRDSSSSVEQKQAGVSVTFQTVTTEGAFSGNRKALLVKRVNVNGPSGAQRGAGDGRRGGGDDGGLGAVEAQVVTPPTDEILALDSAELLAAGGCDVFSSSPPRVGTRPCSSSDRKKTQRSGVQDGRSQGYNSAAAVAAAAAPAFAPAVEATRKKRPRDAGTVLNVPRGSTESNKEDTGQSSSLSATTRSSGGAEGQGTIAATQETMTIPSDTAMIVDVPDSSSSSGSSSDNVHGSVHDMVPPSALADGDSAMVHDNERCVAVDKPAASSAVVQRKSAGGDVSSTTVLEEAAVPVTAEPVAPESVKAPGDIIMDKVGSAVTGKSGEKEVEDGTAKSSAEAVRGEEVRNGSMAKVAETTEAPGVVAGAVTHGNEIERVKRIEEARFVECQRREMEEEKRRYRNTTKCSFLKHNIWLNVCVLEYPGIHMSVHGHPHALRCCSLRCMGSVMCWSSGTGVSLYQEMDVPLPFFFCLRLSPE